MGLAGLAGLPGISGIVPGVSGIVPPVAPDISIPNMTSENTPAPYVVSQSSFLASGTFRAWRLFDGKTVFTSSVDPSRWLTATGSAVPSWFSIDLGASYAASKIILWRGGADSSRPPKNWRLQTSPDNAVWGDVLTVTDWSRPSVYSPGAEDVFPKTSSRYWRVYIDANHGNNSNTELFRVELFN